MHIVAPQDDCDPQWLAFRLALWPDCSEAEHLRGMSDASVRCHYVRLAVTDDGMPLGFVEASKRVDYVNGTNTSPVAFIEGLYVAAESRRRGVARALIDSVSQWAAREGCRELASDSLIDNTAAHAAHCALGFAETERVVYFCKALHDA